MSISIDADYRGLDLIKNLDGHTCDSFPVIRDGVDIDLKHLISQARLIV
jgi:hypothetical protein